MNISKLPLSFYLNDDVVDISKKLLGKFLVTNLHGQGITSGMIVETEAYAGTIDKASHAWNNRLTPRTKTMYQQGGIGYVYLIYGFYNLFNVVTNTEGTPHAILIRAIEPAEGIDVMLERRKLDKVSPRISAGPGLLTQALGISREQNGIDLTQEEVWIEERGVKIPKKNIVEGPRVNVAYADDHALLPWRFSIKDNKWVSKAK